MSQSLPILYSFRRCPYAIRARVVLLISGIQVEMREVLLKEKPDSMVALSSKGTVPVLLLENGRVIDESLDVMQWALSIHDPDGLLEAYHHQAEQQKLIERNDTEFKHWLDRYKYHVGYPQQTQDYYQQQAEAFIQSLDECFNTNSFLMGTDISLADIAIFPFVRQFAFVDKDWFDKTPYHGVKNWLDFWLEHKLFKQSMEKYTVWHETHETVLFPR